MAEKRKACSNCEGTSVRLCPFCCINVRDDNGRVISHQAGPGCRACWGKGIFVCPVCDGKGFEIIDEIEIPVLPAQENTAK